jgi:NADH-quinone oxidoreductase subunit A
VIAEYAGIVALLICALCGVSALLVVGRLVAPRRPTSEPSHRHEEASTGMRRARSIDFFVVLVLFIVFNVGVLFFYPWAVIFRQLGGVGLVAISLFALPLVVGLVYQWSKGSLEW